MLGAKMETSTMSISKINELAKEVLDIEANSILRLKNNIGEDFDRQLISFLIVKAE